VAKKTEVGKAVLFIQQASGKVNVDEFLEDESGRDPYHRALGLWRSCEDDFPGAIWSIGMNDRARDLMAEANMHAMGFKDYDHAEAQGRS
jgi:hypothetical protein